MRKKEQDEGDGIIFKDRGGEKKVAKELQGIIYSNMGIYIVRLITPKYDRLLC